MFTPFDIQRIPAADVQQAPGRRGAQTDAARVLEQ
jgi:hypothetical protein